MCFLQKYALSSRDLQYCVNCTDICHHLSGKFTAALILCTVLVWITQVLPFTVYSLYSFKWDALHVGCSSSDQFFISVSVLFFLVLCCQGSERQAFLTSLAQFCRSTVNEEQCIAHKLLGEKFQVWLTRFCAQNNPRCRCRSQDQATDLFLSWI